LVPARQQGIPLLVRSTLEPDAPGTRIEAGPLRERPPVRAIAHRAGVGLATVTSSRLVPQHTFLARVFAELDELQCDVGPVAVAEAAVTFAVEHGRLAGLAARLQAIGEVQVARDLAVVGVVGDPAALQARGAADVLATLAAAGIAPRCAGQGALGSTVAFVVPAADLARTVALLHQRFFPA
jgi:aspartokinase